MSLRRCPPPAPRMHHHTHTRTKAFACTSHALCSCDKCCVLKVPSQLHIRKQRMSITNDASLYVPMSAQRRPMIIWPAQSKATQSAIGGTVARPRPRARGVSVDGRRRMVNDAARYSPDPPTWKHRTLVRLCADTIASTAAADAKRRTQAE